MRGNTWAFLGCLFAFTAVLAGAFGAHALRDRLGPEALSAYEVGVRYQMVHALALLGLGLGTPPGGLARRLAGGAFVLGIILFSGSLYALSLTGVKGLGAVTPAGGAAFLVGWAALAAEFRLRRKPQARQ